jgi:hypothetical protein
LEVQVNYYTGEFDLNWKSPEFMGPDDQWLHWDDGINYDAIGANAAIEFEVAARWSPEQLSAFEGGSVTQISFYPYEEAATYRVRVWTGVMGSGPANMVADQAVPSPVIESWNTVTLTTPVMIDVTQDLWIGYYINTTTGWPAGCDNGPAIDGYGNMINWDGWQTLLELQHTLDYNWNIAAWMEFADSSSSPSKYAIYRSDESDPYFLRDYSEENFYLDDSVCDWHYYHEYKVTALLINGNDTCESGFSNEGFEICIGIVENHNDSIRIYPNPGGDWIRVETDKQVISRKVLVIH